jgi:hypothetical protein
LRVGAREDAVIQSFEGDAFLDELPLDVFVTVDAKLGVVREIRAELQKERAEVVVDAVEIEYLITVTLTYGEMRAKGLGELWKRTKGLDVGAPSFR